jgi:uncharacterized Zn-finger protein
MPKYIAGICGFLRMNCLRVNFPHPKTASTIESRPQERLRTIETARNPPFRPLWCRPVNTDMGMAETIVPHFHNDLGVPVIEIGAKEFMCVGAMPPFDHPHVYCDMGGDNEFVCPYCSTLYRYDPSLASNAARPAECALHDAA